MIAVEPKETPRLYRGPGQAAFDLAVLAVAMTVLNAVLVVWGRTTFVPLTFLAAAGVLFGLNLLALAAVVYAFSRTTMNDAARLTLRALIVSAAAFASVCLSLPFTRQLIARDVRNAQQRADLLLPDLDAHLARTGLYPLDLAAVAGERPLPRLLSAEDAYRSSGTGFVLQIRIPGSAFQAFVYRSSDRGWQVAGE